MAFFRWSKKKVVSRPGQRIQLTDHLQAALWFRENEAGQSSIYWAMDRLNPADATRPFRSLRPEDLFEVPRFIARLSGAMAEGNLLPLELRRKLGELSLAMAQAGELLSPPENGRDSKDSLNGSRALAFE